MPVSIHIADPKAFFEPYNERNERWKELKDHPRWWFGDTNKFPTFHGLLEAMLRVIARHPHTTFVCVHFGNNSEELDWVDRALAKHPNMMVDLAARVPEIGRHDPQTVRRLFIKYQDRIFFATDFQSLESRMILGSSGPEPPPSVADAEVFFRKEYRWLETLDKNWEHMTPIQGDWKISSIGLPTSVLRKIYFDNARKLLVRSLPVPVVVARRTTRDFTPDGDLDKELWQTSKPIRLECRMIDGSASPNLSTAVRMLWSTNSLYIGYECPFTRLTVFEPAQSEGERFDVEKKGVSLWDRDVIEAFIATDAEKPARYAEFEVAPSNEKLDVMVNLPEKDFQWSSHFVSAVRIDRKKKVWTCESRIPLNALTAVAPADGTKWRINFYRKDQANHAFLAWRPTLTNTTHTPERFGLVQFSE
jgi:hypothetical protein